MNLASNSAATAASLFDPAVPARADTRSARSPQTFTCGPICNSKSGTAQWPALSRARALGSPLILFLSAAAVLSGCSREPSDARQSTGAQPSASSVNPIGEQRYRCGDGSRWHVDTLADGLTVTLTPMPDGKQERLSAPAQGLTYVGDRIAATFSKNALTIERSDGPSVACQQD